MWCSTNGSEEQRNREGTSVPHGTEFKHIYETVRSQIPNADPLPTLNRARGMVREGERRWNIAQGRNEQMDSSAFLARGTNGPGGRVQCDYCRKIGHTRSDCWKLNGYPADWEQGKRPGQHGGGNNGRWNSQETGYGKEGNNWNKQGGPRAGEHGCPEGTVGSDQ
ncbi:hypothetical protein CDL15_Pgr000627 [Punica granatum]|uniref:CCHC-type domain-containing protein n=1 Tax=Punica granatum TaxID=22663 RepID=A0A218W329_PUNGR|nr:hypothetical protein CDL15_Pgr000627 [Punica granatum]